MNNCLPRRQWVQVVVPMASLLACVCGVVLILGFVSKGALSGLSVFIPCAILGGISVILIILGTIASANCTNDVAALSSGETEPRRRRRRDNLSTRQRMDIIAQLRHIEHTNGYTMDEEKTCSICLSEDPPQRVVLNCGHIYHEKCVKEWLRRARFARCPLCRTALDATPNATTSSTLDEQAPRDIDQMVNLQITDDHIV